MIGAETFSIMGQYRVQSRRASRYSELRGTWLVDNALLDSTIVNEALSRHPAWRGVARVNLRPARVSHRAGTFACEPDILYKREFFTGHAGSTMDVDIVDVEKSKSEWNARRGALAAIFSRADLAAIDARLGDIDAVIANEYFLHEAGHFLGIDVLEKYASGYFSVQGRTLWPLVYVEELRADLGSFEFALQLLPAAEAERIFLYNLALRLGAHRKGIEDDGIEVYGLVPYLLFCALNELDFLSVEDGQLRIKSLESARLRDAMASAARHAHEHFTAPELDGASATDLAIHIAAYVRRRLDDRGRRAMFAAIEGDRER